MVIIAFLSYPPESRDEMAKRMPTAPALPDHMKMKGPYGYSNGKEGVRVTAMYEFDESKMAEAYRAVVARLQTYIGVTGYTFELHVCGEVGDFQTES
ncbi:hypothetical protein ACFLZM_06945 [Thermodesulfobacteriota bacterium]